MALKWNARQITKFFEIYERYVVLWNIKHVDYLNKTIRQVQFTRLMDELRSEDLVPDGTMEIQLKAKIKSLKDSFRQEVAKITKSLKGSSGSSKVYKPKLSWFDDAKFLVTVLSTRESTLNNLNLTRELNVLPTDHIKLEHDPVVPTDETEQPDSVTMKQKASPDLVSKKPKRFHAPGLDNTHGHSVDTITNYDSIDCFGRYIAAQIRSLSKRQGILLQQEIQNTITRFLLDSLPPDCSPSGTPLYEYVNATTPSSPFGCNSSSDVLLCPKEDWDEVDCE